MRIAAQGATFFVAAWLLSGCGSSPAVRQAKLNDPIIVVTVQSTPKKTPEKPQETKAQRLEKALKEAEEFGMIGVLGGTGPSDASIESVFGSSGGSGGVVGGVLGGVPGGVIGGVPGGFGGLGAIGTGSGGGGTGIGLGSIGTIGRGSGGYGLIGIGRGSGERAKAKLGHVLVTGSLTVDVVQRHVDEHRDDIQTCHDLETKQSLNRWGSVTFRLRIDATGHVTDVQVYESTLSSRELESCIAHAIGAFEFPSPGGNDTASVLLPVSF